MGFLAELKKRSVVRVGLAYVAATWLLVQVVETVAPAFGFPDVVLRITVILSVIGFVPAVFLAWAFEITPQGIKHEHEVDRGRPGTTYSGKRLDRAAIVILVIAVSYFAIDKFLIDPSRDAAIQETALVKGRTQGILGSYSNLAVVVLPFASLSRDPDNEIFSDGMSVDILNLLAKLKAFRVIARSSAFAYKGQDIDIPEIANTLDVSHLLEGTVQWAGENIRITAQLVDTATETTIWSENFDRQISTANLLEVQTEIAAAITNELQISLAPGTIENPVKMGTDSMDAYYAFLYGREVLADRNLSKIGIAIEKFAEAIELDPDYAAAYVGLHDACFLHVSYAGQRHGHEACPVAGENLGEYRELLQKAIDLDDSLGEAWISLGWAHLSAEAQINCAISDEQKAKAEHAMRKGWSLSPSSEQAYHWFAQFLSSRCNAIDDDHYLANRREAVEVLQQGVALAPLSIRLNQLLAHHYSDLGETDLAFEVAKRMIDFDPDSYKGYEVLAVLEASMKGRLDRYIKYMFEAYQRNPQYLGALLGIANAYVSLGDNVRANAFFAVAQEMAPPDTNWRSWTVIYSKAVAMIIADQRNEAEKYLEEGLAGELVWTPGLHFLLLNMELADGRIDAANSRMRTIVSICNEAGNECGPTLAMASARAAQAMGDTQRARELASSAWDPMRHEIDSLGWRRLGHHGYGIDDARFLTLLGDKRAAISSLEEAVEDGWRGFCRFVQMTNYCTSTWRFDAEFDVLLDDIRDDPRFQVAFKVIEADMAEQLASVREMERDGTIKLPEKITKSVARGNGTPDQL